MSEQEFTVVSTVINYNTDVEDNSEPITGPRDVPVMGGSNCLGLEKRIFTIMHNMRFLT